VPIGHLPQMGCELFKPVGLSAKWGVDPVEDFHPAWSCRCWSCGVRYSIRAEIMAR